MRRFNSTFSSGFKDYFSAVLVVILEVAACYPIAHLIGYQAVGLIFLMMVALLSLILGRGAVFFAAVLSSAVWNFFFIPPVFTFHIHNAHDVISLIANLMVGLVGATLITRIRKSQLDLLGSRERLKAQNNFLESLNNATSIKDVVKRSAESFKHHFDAEIVIYLKEIGGNNLSSKPFGNATLLGADTFRHACAKFEDRADAPPGFFLLKDPRGVFGVIGIGTLKAQPDPNGSDTLMLSFIAQVTSALEREISVDVAKSQEILVESQKLFGTILNSVSHEIRTPIAIISAAVSNLQDPVVSELAEVREQITGELESAAKRLNYLVENILDMSRIESGSMKLNLQLCDPEDLVGMVLRTLKSELKDHPHQVELDGETVPIMCDISLLNQALINVIHNAAEYSPPGTPVCISIKSHQRERVMIKVADRGPGVPVPALAKLFDKFYRVPGSRSGGTGLGLTIARAITEAHQGSLSATNQAGGGLAITMELPAIIVLPENNN